MPIQRTPKPPSRAGRKWLAAVLMDGLVAGNWAGCSRTFVAKPLNTDYNHANIQDDLRFWHSLPGRSAVCNDEALHALIVLEDGQDKDRSYQDRVLHGKSRGWLPANWDEPADEAIHQGRLASALAIILGMKGGVMMHL